MKVRIKKADDLFSQFARARGIKSPRNRRVTAGADPVMKYIAERLLDCLEEATDMIELVATEEELASRRETLTKYRVYISDAKAYLRSTRHDHPA